jgi:hypothetical protein
MSEAKRIAGKFRTSVPGVGPYCIEFSDNEIVSTRSEERQELIANAEQVKADHDALLTALTEASGWMIQPERFPLRSQSRKNCKSAHRLVSAAIKQVAQHAQKGNKG